MGKASAEQREALLARVRDDIRKGEEHALSLKRKNSRFIYGSIIASALSTVVAGLAAAFGPMVGQGPPAWRVTCGFVALCTAFAAVFSGLHKQMSISERFARATAYIGKLNSLEFALTISNRDPIEVAGEYESTAAAYQDVRMSSHSIQRTNSL